MTVIRDPAARFRVTGSATRRRLAASVARGGTEPAQHVL